MKNIKLKNSFEKTICSCFKKICPVLSIILSTIFFTATVTAESKIPDIGIKKVLTGFKHPVHINHSPGYTGSLYVVEQEGRIFIVENGVTRKDPFLDIRKKVRSGGEMGLLSIAFHPDYLRNGRIYINYTAAVRGLHTIVSEFRIINKYRVDPGSERILLKIKQPYRNHNGGQLAFGPDGMLYIGMGDGGSANDPGNNGQDRTTLLGSLLRIDVNNSEGGKNYGIPAGNPFMNSSSYRREIWAYGLRNPWRFSFDMKTGELYAADVGQDRIEEIDIIVKGGNYGWRIMEGEICTPGVSRSCSKKGYLLPIYSYNHSRGQSVTGGFVYRGSSIPQLQGVYIFADFVSGMFLGLVYEKGGVRASREFFRNDDMKISSFGVDAEGEIYFADYFKGDIYKIVQAK